MAGASITGLPRPRRAPTRRVSKRAGSAPIWRLSNGAKRPPKLHPRRRSRPPQRAPPNPKPPARRYSMPRMARLAPLLLLCAQSLGACAPASPPPPEILAYRSPAALRTCLPQPPVPDDPVSDQDLALFIEDTVTAAADCRD